MNMDKKKYILVVDDSIIITNFVKKIFNDIFEVLVAKDGNEAIQIVRLNQNNIVGMLLDLNMPNCDGFEVLEYFKQEDLFKKIPVSLVTGEESKESITKAFQYPIIDMLTKPFNVDDVKNVLEKTISIHQI